MELLTFIKESFGHVFPLLVAGGFAVAIVIERIRALFLVYPIHNKQAFFDQIRTLVLSGRTADAISLCDANHKKPVSHVVKTALQRSHLPSELIEHGLEMSVGEASQMITKRTAFLATIANVATLLGLFGTIYGLIESFRAVGSADPQQKSTLLAQGISTAMNATMLGLMIAIPCMVAFAFLINRSNRLVHELENSAVRVLDIIKQRYYLAEDDMTAQSAPTSSSSSGNNGQVRRVA